MALYQIPVAPTRGTYFDYQGVQINLSALREHPYLGKQAWVMDISWSVNNVLKTVGGVVISAGVDLVKQYDIPLPSLLVLSSDTPNDDPISTTDINLYIKDDT